MKIKFYIFIFLLSLGFSNKKINLPPDNYDKWNILLDNKTAIHWTNYDNFPICKAERILNQKYSDVFKIIENKINYPNVFRRISKIKLYEDDIIHIHLNMPFPFSKRDYIVKYELVNKQNYSEFYFHSVKHPKSIRPKDSVLLPNAGGKWIIKKISYDKTKVTYIWNGQLLGDFPDWAMTKAWKKQGEEVLEWLNISLNNARY